MTIQDLTIPIIGTFLTSSSNLLLRFYTMFIESRKSDQKNIIEDLQKDLQKALLRIDELEKDNKQLHLSMNNLIEENSKLKGLLASQKQKETMIEEFIKQQSKN